MLLINSTGKLIQSSAMGPNENPTHMGGASKDKRLSAVEERLLAEEEAAMEKHRIDAMKAQAVRYCRIVRF